MFAGKAGKLLFTRNEPNVGFGDSLFPSSLSSEDLAKEEKSEKLFNYMSPALVWNRAIFNIIYHV